MNVLPEILGLVMQLAFFGVIAWAIVRFLGHRREGEDADVDRATSVRRLFVYGLMLVTLILGAVGATMIGRTFLTSGWSDEQRTQLALGLAFMLVAGPAYAFLLRFARGRLRADDGERSSLTWAAYLNIALATSLIVSTVTIHNFLAGAFGVDDFEWRSLAPVVVWAAVWAMHWFWLRPAHGLPGDLHLAVGSSTGLTTMLIVLGGVAYVAADEIYTSVVERVPAGHESPELATWLIATGVGVVVWAWHWLGSYLRAERTSLWHTYVLLIGTLGGLVASVSAGATIAYGTAVWYLGNPELDLPSEHFEHVPVAAAFLVAGLVTWQYHRTVLRTPVGRSEPLRAYDYLMASTGLVATVVGATLALVALFESIASRITGDPSEVANHLILAAILGAVGLPLWWTSWSQIRGHLETDPTAEIGSLSRRLYLVVLFGVGGLTALISLIVVLFVAIDDLLDATFGGETLDSARVGLALLATVTGVAWYHLGVFRSDRALTVRLPSAPALLPLALPRETHVVLIAPRDGELAEALATASGVIVETWVRKDDVPMPDIDIDEIVARILEGADNEVAVVVGPTGADVIPYAT